MGFVSSLGSTLAAPTAAYTPKPAPLSYGIPRSVSGSYAYPKPVYHPATNPNYQSILGHDQLLTTGLAGLGVNQAGNLTGTGQAAILGANRSATRQAALENFGAIPNFSPGQAASAGFTPADISALTRTIATQNPNSVVAQLQRQFQSGQSANLENLAARGMLQSGATTARLNNVAATNQQNYYNAVQSLLNQQLLPAQQTYLSGLGDIQSQRNDLVNQALQRLTGQINQGLYGPTPAYRSWPTTTAITGYGSAAQRRKQAV